MLMTEMLPRQQPVQQPGEAAVMRRDYSGYQQMTNDDDDDAWKQMLTAACNQHSILNYHDNYTTLIY